jgi:AraC-like DNA-binding protein
MRARHFIRQYACQGIKTEQVADYVGVSRSSLEEHFRRELGRTVHQEILRHKLEHAQALLAKNEVSNAEVAIRCGFTSVQYMYAVFRRELDCTPKEFQERLRAQADGSDVGLAGKSVTATGVGEFDASELADSSDSVVETAEVASGATRASHAAGVSSTTKGTQGHTQGVAVHRSSQGASTLADLIKTAQSRA